MNLDVYDVHNATYIDTLAEAHGLSFVADVRVPGAISFTVDLASSDDIALLQPRRFVRLRTGETPGDGDLLPGIVQDRPADLAVNDERPVVRVECPGGLDVLGYQTGGAVLAPYGGVGDDEANPLADTIFEPDFDDSDWGAPPTDGELTTEGWPDEDAVAFEAIFPGERSIYRRVSPATGTSHPSARMYVAASIGTRVSVFLDGQRILTKPPGFQGLFTVDASYDDEDKVIVIETSGGDGRFGWTWMSLDASGDPDQTIRRTFDPFEFPSADTFWTSFEGSQPYPGVKLRRAAQRQQNPRMFGWLAPDFDDSGWGEVAGSSRIGSRPSTDGWPDPHAVAYETVFPGERALYRRYLPAGIQDAGPARMYLVATISTEVTVYLDSESVLEKPAGQTGLFHVDIPYEDMEHLVAVEINGGTGRWAWTWLRLEEDPEGNAILGEALRRTYDPDEFPDAETPWLSYEGDLPYPGVTVGYVMKTAVDEAQARGEIPDITYDFDADVDSDGVPWVKQFTRGFRVQKLGRLLDSLSAFGCEPELTPDGTLRLFQKRGSDRTDLTVTAPFALSLSGRGVQATRALYETDGGFGWATNEHAETLWGVVMADVGQFGEDIDPDSAADAIADQLIEDGQLRDEIDIDLPDDLTPYEDVELGDVVMCVSALDGSEGPVRLTSFTAVRDDQTGHVEWSAVGIPDPDTVVA